MTSLFDLISQAQNGRGVDLLARQFNLNTQQAQLAVEALLPAFSEGLRRNAATPFGAGNFLQALAAGQHAQYFEDALKAFTPAGLDAGNSVLGQLFGSKDLSRAVAANAQAVTGISQEVFKQMLPVLASMLMGGMFKQTTGLANAAGMGGGNPFGEIIEQMMKQGMGGAAGGGATRAPGPMDNPFGKMLEQMMGGGQGSAEGKSSGNPWIDMMEQMMRGGQARTDGEAPPQGNPLEEVFGQMFETGRKAQDDYQQGVKSIFDQYVKNMERLR
jgi:hypothetical protein